MFLIQRLDPAKQVDAYNIKVQELYPWEGVVTPPFGGAWAIVKPGGSTKHHGHQDCESFFFAQGQGTMRIGDESREVRAGDVTFQTPFEQHIVTNTSQTEDLIFLTIYWEDLKLWQGRPAAAASALPQRTLITAAPPTPNGDLHLGHLSGPYLAGDLINRYLKLRGVEAHYVFGTDDNQSYVQFKGQQLGKGAAETADMYAADIAATLKAAEIDLDLLSRPNVSPTHVPLVQAFFKRLYDEGKLVEKEAPSPFCETCQLYLFESHIRGGCPHCGAMTGGNACEECGRPNDCDLIDPSCTHCGGKPVQRLFKRLYFPLSRYAKELKEFHLHVAMNPSLRSLCEQILAAGLPDMAVTHVAPTWGIPVPVAGYEDQTIFVWCEMAPRYLSYAQELELSSGRQDADWRHYWKSADASVVQCFGFDNGFYYGLFVPALLLAFDAEIRLPQALVMNEFYRLDGLKFSTSRRHAIWGREIVAQVPADVVRFYLAYSGPETEGTNFTRAEFDATVERELVNTWQPWLVRLGERMARDFSGVVPATGDWLEEHRRFYERVEALLANAASGYEPRTFSPQQATRAAIELVRTARRFSSAEANWQRVAARGEERRTGIALELLAVKALALMIAPVMPQFAARLWSELGYPGPFAAARWEERPEWVPAGQKVTLGGIYFNHTQLRDA